ncbi:cobalamin-binding protein [Shewanella gelidii]|uniref:Cobalamin-binding protein n=2 Tax=Shewanella gelidii TaxID=1642821 RepID=A0A917JPV8_9GAMM|nr:cobalamin-binding protein [Shewanella gelidii]
MSRFDCFQSKYYRFQCAFARHFRTFMLLLSVLGCGSATAEGVPAKRVVALSPHSVEMLFAIGAGDTIVATTEHADYPQAAKHIDRIGGYHGIQIERIIELNPDLIVIWDSGNKAEDIQKLRQLGFQLYGSDPHTLAAVADDLLNLGELTGHRQQAELVAADYLQQLQALRATNQQKAEVSVFYQLWSTPLMTVAKDSWIQQIIDVCHGKNVFENADTDYPQISVENVLVRQPQVILQTQDKGNANGVDWSRWPEIPAVVDNQIYQLNADLLHRAAPRALLGIQSVCDVLDQSRAELSAK